MKTIKTNRVLLAFSSIMIFATGVHAVEHPIEGLIGFAALLFFMPIIIEDEEY